jgi:hypothetical protein
MHFNIGPLVIFLAMAVGQIYSFYIQISFIYSNRLFPLMSSGILNATKFFQILTSKSVPRTNPEQEDLPLSTYQV